MAAKERAIHLDCEVFTECHVGETLCGITNHVFDITNMEIVKNPSKVTCGRCRATARKMIRILRKIPVFIDDYK